ncbi:MAG: S41 family peptidase [Bacteroidales bacterium]|jgi:carboxyl-terminal processing protease|nr:S41 family peptidase [Bacteroidales bacterium]
MDGNFPEKYSRWSVSRVFPFIITFLLGVMFTLAFYVPRKKTNLANSLTSTDKLMETMQFIRDYYVDTVNESLLIETCMNSLLQNLDPHSAYITAADNKTMQESLDGAFEGIGVQFNVLHDTVNVVAVISGGPSEKAGLRAGDRILKVDGENFTGKKIDNTKVFKTLRGKKGTKVELDIQRRGFANLYHYSIVRDVIPTYTVDVSYLLDPRTGYIKINQFGSSTADEFRRALDKLQQQGMARLVIDLRGNSGGYLDAAIQICDELLPSGNLIVYTEGAKVRPEKVKATRGGCFESGKLAILIDEYSASASEIVAGAVQDNDRGIIVGRRSFGKGLVQRQFDFPDHSSVRLTIARYYTPSGRSIQKDYHLGSVAYNEEVLQRYLDGELDSVTCTGLDTTHIYHTREGRVVYGGGGIMPDEFVPLDRDTALTAFFPLVNSGAVIEFAFEYTSTHRNVLQQRYPTVETFVKNMSVTDDMINNLIHYYSTEICELPFPKVSAASEQEIKRWLKAFIGRNLYREDAFYPVINQSDKTIKRALEIL